MKTHRRKFTSKFKSKVVLEAITERETLSELAVKFDLHPNQIAGWKKNFMAKAHMVFEIEENHSAQPKINPKKNDSKMKGKIVTPFDSDSLYMIQSKTK